MSIPPVKAPRVRVPRVAVAGVVRRRQGLGEHLAHFLVRHGAEVPAFLASRPETIPEAQSVLARHGIEAAGYVGLDALLAEQPIDALVIASPAATHATLLEGALAAGLHVLCEKPLLEPVLWGGDDDVERVASLVDAFAERELTLVESCQWPYTLPAYRELHPASATQQPRHVEMWLSPSSRGRDMLVDSMSHPLSLLQALAPPTADQLAGLSFSTVRRDAGRLQASFRYPTASGGVVVRVRLESHPEQPRPAGFAINGLAAARRIRMEDYALSFEDGGRQVPVPDPTERLVEEFVRTLRGEDRPVGPQRGAAIVWRQGALREIVGSFERLTA